MTRRQAITEARDCANAVIEQLERHAKGWDRGMWRQDMREVDRNHRNTIRATVAMNVGRAFELSKEFSA